MNEELFWLVWNPEGGNPRFRHSTYEDAKNEANRLASINTGRKFYVMKAKMLMEGQSNVKTIKLRSIK